ncbi:MULTISPECIES: hypothetical protein [unclassified Mesorhizobium]|uniref:hypothetical protein n=1 Tax=unclassified Mesorhizobium TaxID=325217 RepID=UPI000BAFFF49|nr:MULTISPECIES: hypothetical protein [unclassified Mesorhizobium]TGT56844.1 hypothetical protein EN813_041220 [Mesorhizobium sp. M00.F.Ca.ET.170.01.1.1]AZO08610.1 hypothetical protein EJ074_05320 [Mesorhizobium sp. M3A.F.Ca.ET.080.04.2.1]PBB85490.1 hypothetical protein CK216_17710 [Mesorhizobium sp. WSM3876]RWB71727.1 MAG: hypothetical protein EOQ49_14530 [Mesorhizobium sp.]RWB85021.1 MAG: hypothetical protein EOQ52_22380 [Mesorhizobium sp.]
MSSPPTLNAAVLIQQRPVSIARPVGDGVAAGSSPAASGAGASRSQTLHSLFSVTGLNVTATKVRLMERAGKEFSLEQGDYASVMSYGSAVKNAVEALKQHSPSAIVEIEKQLGLDQLGIPLDTLVDAIVDPQGRAGNGLDVMLKQRLAEIAGDGAGKVPITADEIGLYGR